MKESAKKVWTMAAGVAAGTVAIVSAVLMGLFIYQVSKEVEGLEKGFSFASEKEQDREKGIV